MGKLSHWLASVAVLAMIVVVFVPVAAQDSAIATSFAAHIHAGTCDQPGEVVAPLTDLVSPTGERVGSEEATAAATSYSSVSLSLDALLESDYVIDVHQAADDQTIACGEIGGTRDTNGALTVGLRSTNNYGFNGIAYLSPGGDPSQTGISTFLAETGVAAGVDIVTDQEGAETIGEGTDSEIYPTTVRRQVTLLVGSLQRVDALVDEPRPDDQAWGDQLAAELTLWQILHQDAQELTPPEELTDFHNRYVEALALLDSAARDVFEGLESGDQERLSQAGSKIDQAIQAIRALDVTEDAATPAAGT